MSDNKCIFYENRDCHVQECLNFNVIIRDESLITYCQICPHIQAFEGNTLRKLKAVISILNTADPVTTDVKDKVEEKLKVLIERL